MTVNDYITFYQDYLKGLEKDIEKELFSRFIRVMVRPVWGHLALATLDDTMEDALLAVGTSSQLVSYYIGLRSCQTLDKKIQKFAPYFEKMRVGMIVNAWTDKEGQELKEYDLIYNQRDVPLSKARAGLKRDLKDHYNIKYSELSNYIDFHRLVYNCAPTTKEIKKHLLTLLQEGVQCSAKEEMPLML